MSKLFFQGILQLVDSIEGRDVRHHNVIIQLSTSLIGLRQGKNTQPSARIFTGKSFRLNFGSVFRYGSLCLLC